MGENALLSSPAALDLDNADAGDPRRDGQRRLLRHDECLVKQQLLLLIHVIRIQECATGALQLFLLQRNMIKTRVPFELRERHRCRHHLIHLDACCLEDDHLGAWNES